MSVIELNAGSYDDIYLEIFCRQILDKDYFIRSAKIADHLGHIIASAYTPGLIELMSPKKLKELQCKPLFVLQHVINSNQK
jgi:hypothetical protein